MSLRPECLVLVECNKSYGRELALRAPQLGLTPVVLTAVPERFTDEATAGVDVRACDTRSPAAVLEAVREVQRSYEVRALGAGYEGVLPVASLIARALGLPGPSPVAAEDCLHKPRARALSNGFVGNPVRFWLLDSLADAAAIDQDAFPLVVKPAASGGSIGVATVHTHDELDAHVRRWLHAPDERGRPLEGPLLAERLVSGDEYSVETFDGVPLALTRKLLGGRTGLVETGHVVVGWADAPQRASLDPYLAALTSRLGLDWGPAHIELRVDRGQVRLIEVNYRLAGDFIPDLVELALGIDMYDATLRAMRGERVCLAPRARSAAAIRFLVPEQDGTVRAMTAPQAATGVPGVVRVAVSAAPGRTVRAAAESGDRLGHVMATGAEPDAALRAADAGLAALGLRITPADPRPAEPAPAP